MWWWVLEAACALSGDGLSPSLWHPWARAARMFAWEWWSKKCKQIPARRYSCSSLWLWGLHKNSPLRERHSKHWPIVLFLFLYFKEILPISSLLTSVVPRFLRFQISVLDHLCWFNRYVTLTWSPDVVSGFSYIWWLCRKYFVVWVITHAIKE